MSVMEQQPARTRRSFTDEFKRDAVAMVLDEGHKIVEVARRLGIGEGTLGNWVRQERTDRGERAGLTTSEKAELAELRREMPRARATSSPFVLIQLSLEDLDGVRQRRGDEFAERSVNALVETLKRLTRSSDFLAHLGGARFCVMLVDCTLEQSYIYLKRVPGVVSVSAGHNMLPVPVTARVHQYDLEALYATDVLRDLEETKPLRRREPPRLDSLAA